MPVVSEARLIEIAQNDPGVFRRLPFTNADHRIAAQANALVAGGPNVDVERLRELLASIRRVLTEERRQQHKGGRPWEIDYELYARMDRREPWWGFEFELGYKSAAAYAEAVGYAYDEFTGAMFDGEGEGDYPVEITFPPEEVSKFADGTSQAHRFMLWTAQNAQRLCRRTGNNNVGTHLNMSDPRLNARTVRQVANFLNNTLRFTSRRNGERREMFGRESIYAGFFLQNVGQNHWMEFKGFRTTYDAAEWQRYLKVCAALQKCIDFFFAQAKVNVNAGINNLYDVAFNDAEPAMSLVRDFRPPADAAPLTTRHFGDRNGLGGAFQLAEAQW